MTSARRSPAHPHLPPLNGDLHLGTQGDAVSDAAWPMALRALLLLSGAVTPGDAALARLSDEDLSALRASLSELSSIEPTNAA